MKRQSADDLIRSKKHILLQIEIFLLKFTISSWNHEQILSYGLFVGLWGVSFFLSRVELWSWLISTSITSSTLCDYISGPNNQQTTLNSQVRALNEVSIPLVRTFCFQLQKCFAKACSVISPSNTAGNHNDRLQSCAIHPNHPWKRPLWNAIDIIQDALRKTRPPLQDTELKLDCSSVGVQGSKEPL